MYLLASLHTYIPNFHLLLPLDLLLHHHTTFIYIYHPHKTDYLHMHIYTESGRIGLYHLPRSRIHQQPSNQPIKQSSNQAIKEA